LGLERITESFNPVVIPPLGTTSSIITLSLPCPSNKTIISGGYDLTGSVFDLADVFVIRNFPTQIDEWRIDLINGNPVNSTDDLLVILTAICANS